MDDRAQFRMRSLGGRPADRLHDFDIRVQKGFAQHTLPNHPGSAEDYDIHRRPD